MCYPKRHKKIAPFSVSRKEHEENKGVSSYANLDGKR
jgi:hypothetical protein